jgi:hypothetical protein
MMEQDDLNLNRRSFVKLAAATGIGAAVSEKKTYAGEPREPDRTVVLQSSSLKVTLNSSIGSPSRYQLIEGKGELMGDDVGSPIQVRVCRNPWARSDYRPRFGLRAHKRAMWHLLCMSLLARRKRLSFISITPSRRLVLQFRLRMFLRITDSNFWSMNEPETLKIPIHHSTVSLPIKCCGNIGIACAQE